MLDVSLEGLEVWTHAIYSGITISDVTYSRSLFKIAKKSKSPIVFDNKVFNPVQSSSSVQFISSVLVYVHDNNCMGICTLLSLRGHL